MTRYRLFLGLAICAVCGSAFAGGMLANGVRADYAAAAGALVAVPGAAFTALVYLHRQRLAQTPNQALQQTPAASAPSASRSRERG